MVDDDQSEIRARLALKKRDLRAAQSCASELEGLGFDVTSVSDRGVGFEGSRDLFESAFVSRVIVVDAQLRFTMQPVLPARIANYVASVYFPTRPTLFS